MFGRGGSFENLVMWLGLPQARRGGAASNEFMPLWPPNDILIAGVRVVPDEGDIGSVDLEQVEVSDLRFPAELDMGCLSELTLDSKVEFPDRLSPDLVFTLATISVGHDVVDEYARFVFQIAGLA